MLLIGEETYASCPSNSQCSQC